MHTVVGLYDSPAKSYSMQRITIELQGRSFDRSKRREECIVFQFFLGFLPRASSVVVTSMRTYVRIICVGKAARKQTMYVKVCVRARPSWKSAKSNMVRVVIIGGSGFSFLVCYSASREREKKKKKKKKKDKSFNIGRVKERKFFCSLSLEVSLPLRSNCCFLIRTYILVQPGHYEREISRCFGCDRKKGKGSCT